MNFFKNILTIKNYYLGGYTCASAFHVVASQLKELLGLKNLIKYDGLFKIPKVDLKYRSFLTSLFLTFLNFRNCLFFEPYEEAAY